MCGSFHQVNKNGSISCSLLYVAYKQQGGENLLRDLHLCIYESIYDKQ